MDSARNFPGSEDFLRTLGTWATRTSNPLHNSKQIIRTGAPVLYQRLAQLTVDIGGRAGVDCRGFCEYCYFKRVKTAKAFGCRYCMPFKKGCDYCTKGVREEYTGFKDLRTIAQETLAALQTKSGDLDRITISGGGDPSCYPQFTDLIELLGATGAPLHIGYTSGKGWDDEKIADLLIENGLAECSFNVYAAAVVLPGVNDGEVLEHTCAWLEDRGARGLILMRFANTTEQGLILENAPVLKDQTVQSVESFRDLVSDLNRKFKMKISGTPLWDPEIGSPFAILHEPALLKKLPRVQRRASVITGSVAAPFISEILSARGATAPVIPVRKEIACLITEDDLREIDSSFLQPAVIIPGRAFVHDAEAQKIMSRDGTDREVIRGPDQL